MIKLIVNYNYRLAPLANEYPKESEIITFEKKEDVSTDAIRKKLKEFHPKRWINIETINQIF